MAEDVRIEQFHEQLIEIRMDEPGLGEQLLRGGLVVRLGGRREVSIDEHALAIAVATAWMDRQALEVQENLDLVLGDFDAQFFVAVDVWGAVIVTLDGHITVRMQRGVFPISELDVPVRQRLQSGFLDCLKTLPSRDAEAGVAAVVDTLDALAERLIYGRQGDKTCMPIAETHVAHQYFHESFRDSFILRVTRARRNNTC
jgi:hypothetical protein